MMIRCVSEVQCGEVQGVTVQCGKVDDGGTV